MRTLNKEKDHSGIWATILTIVVGVMFVLLILALIMTFAGVFIGGFYALKNYFISFKHGVLDSNRAPA